MKKLLLIKTIFCLLVFASCKSAVNNEEFIYPSLDGVSDSDTVDHLIHQIKYTVKLTKKE